MSGFNDMADLSLFVCMCVLVCVELLQQYSTAIENALKVKADYNLHVAYLQSPQMIKKQRELRQQEMELKEIEKTLCEWI